jgi:hypothetical protein
MYITSIVATAFASIHLLKCPRLNVVHEDDSPIGSQPKLLYCPILLAQAVHAFAVSL